MNILLIPALLLMVACATQGWSYKYTGQSDNWDAVIDIIPDKEDGARFIGKINHLTNQKVTHIHYEATVTFTSQQAGNVKDPSFQNGHITLFQDVPNTDTNQDYFRNGVTAEQVKQFFGEHPAFTITWKTEQGEFTETIPLTFAEPN
ncbi:hypothetical protein ACFLFF_31175 [Brevibacillus reuszeri]|uniref:hypothetical protein n=1 Tax=Brevibacillus reuszeri TaxID=54915 RepID=UPI003671113B